MTTWQQFESEAPEMAAAVRARFTATKHHVLATLSSDGAPRVSGTEVQFSEYSGGDLTIGSMPRAVKAKDLQRDGRFALHANPGDGSMAGGDAKLSGQAVEILDEELVRGAGESFQPPDPAHLFRLSLSGAVLVSITEDGQRLRIDTWRRGEGTTRVER